MDDDASGNDQAAAQARDSETRRFLESLKASGQLMEVEFDTDVSQLPSYVTHVQYPDGQVKRIAFS